MHVFMLLVSRVFLVKKQQQKKHWVVIFSILLVSFGMENLLIMDTKHAQSICCGVGVNHFRISQPTLSISMFTLLC